MIASTTQPVVTWEKLPDDFVLPDDPVDNILQPTLAAALTESLVLAGKLPETALTSTNYGICATVDGKMVVKAPDWAYIPSIRVPRLEVHRSYTPKLQGDLPLIVMEFLSDKDGSEYSIKPTYPPGKWFFYERVLQVPYYAIFDLATGSLELYKLEASEQYQLLSPDAQHRYWLPEMNLALGIWSGLREHRPGSWLRWWDASGSLLPWGIEKVEQERQRAEQEHQRAEQERQRAEQEHQRAEQERQRAERLVAQLRAAGLDLDQ
ncbi:Uma2 family endonuclease [Synechococcales cyanobacterium C]|uniref:Uma2 family endonuclease n=1 Tax=Petrachloros mirabilis ULC683 TaxID=2781853 RepID=A0A8K1ZXB9_9CYAN|nr:Uma2 family endonuclease [Petrachloros mirabilis]NCJ05392.1 Uma2 family endonuclease [Petrachloros mirabilis ULC683]